MLIRMSLDDRVSIAVTPTETLNAGGGNASPGTARQILVKPEPSTEGLAA